MKKLFFLVAFAATISLATSCKDKEKDHSEDEMDDLTLVISAEQLA
jgi:ABC-type phosphate/phosphonate transport system substrate-binding protein